MSLISPNLDDRRFHDLMEEALKTIRNTCPAWTDLTPSDPGIVLLESFAHLTETMIYRLNRLPDKAYIEFLKLLGVKLFPPSSAAAVLTFSLTMPQNSDVVIPLRTRVTTKSTGSDLPPPVFYTHEKAVIKKGELSVNVTASHCNFHDGELIGRGTGRPGLTLTLKNAPVAVASVGQHDFIVGVETPDDELEERTPAIKFQGKIYRIWNETENFTGSSETPYIYTVDRTTGIVFFAPEIQSGNGDSTEILGNVIKDGREVRAWYTSGGGPGGNIGPATLTKLKDPIQGISVTNTFAATGGREQESIKNAILRGPRELHSLERAVTAEDFELIAMKSSGGVIRAKAFTKAALWAHAQPGTVEILIVPNISENRDNVSLEMLKTKENNEILSQIQNALLNRMPLGTTCLVNWVRYKTVNVKAKVAVHRGQDPNAVKQRVEERLYKTINPLPDNSQGTGWSFGKPLRISDVYDIILKEPGVSYADNVFFTVDDVPNGEITSVVEDHFQKNTWYASDTTTLYRTMNNGKGWEAVLQLTNDMNTIESVCLSKNNPGAIALNTKNRGDIKSTVYFSSDCGESWSSIADTAFEIEDITLSERDGIPLLLMATDVGLYELWAKPGSVPVQLLVDNENQDSGFYKVTTAFDNRGTQYVIASSQKEKGIYMSAAGGKTGTFKNIGLKGKDIRTLAIQIDGPRTFLWAGPTVMGNDDGDGCCYTELTGSDISKDGWSTINENWVGGSVRAIAFMESTVFAATHRGGVLAVNMASRNRIWRRPNIRCGLPSRDTERLFQPVSTLAVNTEQSILLTGTPEGVFTSKDGENFTNCSENSFTEKVTLPETWLFCSGTHEIHVETDGEN